MKKSAMFACATIILLLLSPRLLHAGEYCVTGDLCVTQKSSDGKSYPAAMTKEAIMRVIEFFSAGDYEAAQTLLEMGVVFLLKPGIAVYVEDTSIWQGWVKLRKKGSTISFYTLRDAIRPR